MLRADTNHLTWPALFNRMTHSIQPSREDFCSGLGEELISPGDEEEAKKKEKKAADEENHLYEAGAHVLSAHGYAVRDKAVPHEIRAYMAREECDDACQPQPAREHDITHADGKPPDEPIWIGKADDNPCKDRVEALARSFCSRLKPVRRQAPHDADAHAEYGYASQKRNDRIENPVSQEAAETEHNEQQQKELEDAVPEDHQRADMPAASRGFGYGNGE